MSSLNKIYCFFSLSFYVKNLHRDIIFPDSSCSSSTCFLMAVSIQLKHSKRTSWLLCDLHFSRKRFCTFRNGLITYIILNTSNNTKFINIGLSSIITHSRR
ncbi:unnamed protein product [Moneuplotes crassus]|uniref:Uncharacterized protein n=1 Tax=Euplotes crassus TaxID=5936 RepID=A0AAD1XQB5_EUPCR|nr:unnamed protein product [Moneuplotes crassus]